MFIIGNLTNDPTLRTTQSGVNVCSFTVAVNRRAKQGEEPKADYFRVTAWRERGEVCAKYLSKGKKVCVVGSVSLSQNDSNGKHYANLEVTAEEVQFLSPRDNSGNAATSPTPVTDAESGLEVVEDRELPF